ncbi:Bug family tripartite tricarboxylate transporter substrate binding protein [Variovorax arabinosiphilus]|uniref:Bug family tripartite tricarboxylate transporter substrate binding protein n=1 Tax=Variovorax arabinosiphilus TaxID=3053498 RepID=UPI002578E8BF|nr:MULTISPECIES: tripartite tricarboxylate transporter substrate binding protein [unclassified Variovorax]MDM0119544.1 tripartite tricarboxylate transporter substrate binding protein [Variovorax sp. J2L1-78]MDM0128544.1 tripartite tricarboxylate transporter substrate binding protein [Variovorax sp. J2L1-63]MDM0232244.1 tripartite tricarboxylate transporter substrate binding protein [Variovorax sp. J2R1-6]
MTPSLRSSRTIALLSAALSLFVHAAPVAAEEWPTKPVTMIMGFPAGSGVDVVARAIQEPLAKQLGQPVIIDYKSGAAGNIASEYVARAKADGYTLAFGTAATHGSNAALYKKLPFDVEDDFVAVAPVLDVSNVLTINPEVMNVTTLKEFVDLVKANPGKYNYASTGNGAGTHMAFAEFNSRLGLQMTHVPYKGGPEAISSVVKGETCCIMNQVQTVLPQYKAGKVRLLGVTTAAPVAAVKEVPTIASSGLPGTKGFDSSIWFAVFAPKGTDPKIVDKLNGAIKAVLEDKELRARFEAQGNTVRIESPAQFKKTVHDNRVKWAEVAKAANISID